MLDIQADLLERTSATISGGGTIGGLGRTVSVGDFLRQFHTRSVEGLQNAVDDDLGFGSLSPVEDDDAETTFSSESLSYSSSNSDDDDDEAGGRGAGRKVSKVIREYIRAKAEKEADSDGQQQGPNVEKLFGLFARLHDDEAFDDWLRLGIATTVDPDSEVVIGDNTQHVRSTNNQMKEALNSGMDEFDPSFVLSISRDLSKAQTYEELKQQRIVGRRRSSAAGGGGTSSTSPRRSAAGQDDNESLSGSRSPNLSPRGGAQQASSPRGPRIKRFSVVQQTRSITEKRKEVERYIDKFVSKLDSAAEPQTFSQFVRRCDDLLDELSTGIVSTDSDTIAEAEQMLLTAQEMSASSFGCDLLLTYVVHFLNSQLATNEEDFLVREEIVSRAMVIQADVSIFVQSILQIERKVNEIKDFEAARHSTTEAINALLKPLENLLADINTDVAFPFQRRALIRHQPMIDDYVQSTVLFLQEFDRSVALLIPCHQRWKQGLLDDGYSRLHGAAGLWMDLSLGYIDPLLKKTQRVEDRRSAVSGMKRDVAAHQIIEWMVKDDKCPLSEVAFHFKNVRSDVAGLQLALATRHLADERGPKHDAVWGFSM